MSSVQASDSQTQAQLRVRQWQGRWRRTGWIVAAALVLAVLVTPVVGTRVSTYDDLRSALAAGDVTRVNAAGLLPPSATGHGTVELTWREGFLNRVAEVTEASSRHEAESISYRNEWGPVVVDLESALRSVQPGLTITQNRQRDSYSELHGWRGPLWWGMATFGLLLLTLWYVATGPAPWRANRWAWAWLVLSSPIGIAAYLVLGGPTGLAREPEAGKRRMRGGVGFLLALFLSTVPKWNWI